MPSSTEIAKKILQCQDYKILRQPQSSKSKWQKKLDHLCDDINRLHDCLQRGEHLDPSLLQSTLQRIDKIAKNCSMPQKLLEAKNRLLNPLPFDLPEPLEPPRCTFTDRGGICGWVARTLYIQNAISWIHGPAANPIAAGAGNPRQEKPAGYPAQTSVSEHRSQDLRSVSKTVLAPPGQPQTAVEKKEEIAALPETVSEPKTNFEDFRRMIETPLGNTIDEYEFQHIMGDYFGAKTGFEGLPFGVMTHLLTNFFSHKNAAEHPQPRGVLSTAMQLISSWFGSSPHKNQTESQHDAVLQLMLHRLQIAERLQKSLQHDSFNRFYQNYRDEIEKLDRSDILFFQGGWINKDTPGHAIVYEIIKQPDGLFTFRIYNSGPGLQHHSSQDLEGKHHRLPFIEIVDISDDHILSPTLLKIIHELQQPAGRGTDWSDDDIYQNLWLLHGKISNRIYSMDQVQETLDVGHCTFLSWSALLSQHLGKNGQYQRLIYELQFKTLHDYFESARSKLDQEAVRKLLQKGISHFARKVERLYEANVISSEELRFTSQTIAHILTVLEQAEESHLEMIRASIPELDHRTSSEHFEIAVPLIDFPNAAPRDMPPLLPLIQIPPFRAETFHSDIQAFVQSVSTLREQGHFDLIPSNIIQFIQQIPIHWMEKPIDEWMIWQSISPAEAEDALRSLNELSTLFIYGLWSSSHREYLRIDDYICQVKILTIADAISKSCLKISLPSLYQEHFDLIFRGISSHAGIFDPVQARQIQRLQTYWKIADPMENRIQRTHGSLFSVERHPASPHDGESSHHRIILAHEDSSGYQDINWIIEYLQQPRVRTEIRQRFPKIYDLSLVDQAVYFAYSKTDESDREALAKRNQGILPIAFFILRDLSLQSDLLLRHHPSSKDLLPWKPFRVNVRLTRFQNGKRAWVEQVDPFNLKLSLISNPRIITDFQTVRQIRQSFYLSWDHTARLRDGDLLRFSDDSLSKSLQTIESLTHNSKPIGRRRLAPQQIPFINPDLVSEINIQDLRDLLRISSIPQLQIQELFGYFRQRPSLLTQQPYQIFFKKLLFESSLLMDELQVQPHQSAALADQIIQFCLEQYQSSLQQFQLSSSLYFLEIAGMLIHYIDFAQHEYPEAFPDGYHLPIFDINAAYDQLLSQDSLSDNDRSALQISRGLSIPASGEISPAQVKDLLICSIQINGLSDVPADSSKDLIYPSLYAGILQKLSTTKHLLQNHRLNIHLHLNSKKRDWILNQVIRDIIPHFQDQRWTSDNGQIYHSNDGKFHIDITTGTLFIYGGELRQLPISLQTPLVQQFCDTSEKIIAAQLDPNTWDFSFKGRHYRIKNKPTPVFFQNIDGIWYQHFNVSILPIYLGEGLHGWVPAEETFLPIANVDETILCQSPFEKWPWLISDAHNQIHYRITESQTIRHLFGQYRTIHKIVDGQETGLVLENILDPSIFSEAPYRSLQRFEALNATCVWKKPGASKIHSIDMPRMELHFEARLQDGELKVFSSEIKGFWIAKRQIVWQLGDISQYLLLEGSKGKQIVLIPNRPFFPITQENPYVLPVKKSTLNTNYVMRSIKTTPAYFRYSVSESGELIPQNTNARLHLAMLRLSEHDYYSAHALLKKFSSQTRMLSATEKNQLTQIALFDDINSDHDPRAVAIRLFASYFLARNAIDYHQPDDVLQKTTTILAEYRQKKDQIPPELQMSAAQIRLLGGQVDPVKQPYPTTIPVSPMQFSHKVEASLGRFISSDFQEFDRVSTAASLLRQESIQKNFMTFYSYARSGIDTSKALSWLKKMSGIDFPQNLSIEQLKEEIKSQLIICILSPTTPTEKLNARILLGVLLKPDQFCTSAEMSDLIHKSSEEKKLTEEVKRAETIAISYIETLAIDLSSTPKETILFPRRQPRKQHAVHPFSVSLPIDLPLFNDPATLSDSLELVLPSPSSRESKIAAIRELRKTFHIQPHDRLARQKFENLQLALQQYEQSPALIPPVARIKKGTDLDKLELDLTQEAAQLTAPMEQLSQSILILLNRIPTASLSDEVSKRHLEYASTDRRWLNLDDAILSFYSLDADQLQRVNPSLTLEEIQNIYQQTAEYLVTATYRQKLMRLKRLLAAVRTAEKSGRELESTLAIQSFAAAVQAQRAYDICTHPAYLVFEYKNDILLRKDQIENLEKIMIKGLNPSSPREMGAALEMIMGSGKTAAILPLEMQDAMVGSHTPFFVIPKNLISSQAEQIAQKLEDSFRQNVDVIDIERQTKLDQSGLQRLSLRFQEAREEQKTIGITSDSLQSFFLLFLERLLMAREQGLSPQFETEIDLFRQLIAELRQSPLTIDEMDWIFDILKSHHFSNGTPQKINEEVINTISAFYLLIATNQRLQQHINVEFVPNRQGESFTTIYYDRSIRPILIEEILATRWAVFDADLDSFFQTLDTEKRKLIAAYLNNQAENIAAFEFVARLPSMKIKNCLADLKEEISELFPLTAKKKVNEHYGRVPPHAADSSQSSTISIPYHGKDNPVLGAQFGTDLETINYSLQQYLVLGITEDILSREIELLIEQMAKDVREYRIPINQSLAFIAFQKLCNGLKINPNHVTAIDKKQMLERINQHPDQIIELVKKHVLSELKIYPRQLNTNAQILPILFRVVNGFTGTMWNLDTFPDVFSHINLSDTDIKTLQILWERSPQAVTVIDQSLDSAETLGAVIAQQMEGQDIAKGISFADSGALFRGWSNEMISRSILAQIVRRHPQTAFKGIIFYNDDNELMVIEQGRDHPVSLRETDLAYYQMVAFWDQKHTTGSDLKFAPEMQASITISRHMILRDLLQTVWRLRQLDKGQKVFFTISQEDAQVILTTLKNEWPNRPDAPICLADLLIYLLLVQSQRQGSDNFRALKQKMQNILIDSFVETAADLSVPSENLIEIFDAVKDLFITTMPKDHYLIYGQSSSMAPSREVVQGTLQTLILSPAFQAFRSNPVLQKRFDAVSLQQRIEHIATQAASLLPDYLPQREKYETELSIEAETKKELDQEKEKETEKETQKDYFGIGGFGSYPVFHWIGKGFFQNSYFQFNDNPSENIFLRLSSTLELTFDHFRSKGLPPFFTINAVLSVNQGNDLPRFHPALLSTLNFYPAYCMRKTTFTFCFGTTPNFEPFDITQQTSPYLLIVQDQKTTKIQTILVDPNDAQIFASFLEEDVRTPQSEPREVNICLYHLTNGIIRTSSQGFDAIALEQNPDFIIQKAQSKFLNGAVFYSKAERQALSEWIRQEGSEKLKQFFTDKILAWKPTSRAEFPHSDLARLLKA